MLLCVIPLAGYFHDREAAVGSVNVPLLGVALVCVRERCEKLEQGKPFCNMILKLVWHMNRERNRWNGSAEGHTIITMLLPFPLPVCRFGGAPPHGMARDCCVPPLPQMVSPHLLALHSPYLRPYGLYQGVSPFLRKKSTDPASAPHPRQMSSAPEEIVH